MSVMSHGPHSLGVGHGGWLHGLQVETAVVQPLKDALTEEQWVQHNASLAAEAGAHKQAQEAADRERQLAEAAAAQHQAAEAAEALRHSTLTKVPFWTLAARMHAHSLYVSMVSMSAALNHKPSLFFIGTSSSQCLGRCCPTSGFNDAWSLSCPE